MTPTDFTMTPDAHAAHLLDGVRDTTTPPNETPEQAAKRQASIVELFRAYEPADAVQAMIACHCIALEFMLRGAMRDAANTALDPKLLARLRSSATSISKTLHMWMTKLEKLKAKAEARVTEAAKPAQVINQTKSTDPLTDSPAPPPVAPPPPSVPGLTPRPEMPRPEAARHPGLAALAAKEAQVTGVKPNGHAPGPESRAAS